MTAVGRLLCILFIAASVVVACKTSPPVAATMSTSPAAPGVIECIAGFAERCGILRT